jgi:transposase
VLVILYDIMGIIHHKVVPEGQSVTGSFYLSVLEGLWKRIRCVWREYLAPGSSFLLHDNAPVHRTVAVQEFLAQKQVCMLNHPPYSPDLSPCDYFLFPILKLPLKGRLFEDVQDIQRTVTLSLWAIPQEDLQRSFQSLLDRGTFCIDAEGMYFE